MGRRRQHKHAKMRRLKRHVVQVMLFAFIITAATYLLNTLFKISSNYAPAVNDPKDFDRERLLKKLDSVTDTPAPKGPSQKR